MKTSPSNIIVGPAYPLRGGIADFNTILCKTFRNELNIDSQIISFSLQYPSILFPGESQYQEGPAPEGVPVKSLLNSINPFNWFIASYKISRFPADYIIIRHWIPFLSPCLGTVARIIKFRKKVKIIGLIDNVVPHEKRLGDFQLSNYFLKSCNAFVLMSKTSVEDLQKFNLKKPFICLKHPVNNIFGERIPREEALRKLWLEPSFKYLLFFGIIRPYKGLDLLLQTLAMPGIREMGIKLIIAGEYYEERTRYDKIIKELKIEDLVLDHSGFIPSERVALYFSAADLSVQTYHSATQSGVTQIACSFDLPMLVTGVGGLSEVVLHDKTGYVVSKDIPAISESMIDYFQNNRRREFEPHIQDEKKKHTWKFFASGLHTFATEL